MVPAAYSGAVGAAAGGGGDDAARLRPAEEDRPSDAGPRAGSYGSTFSFPPEVEPRLHRFTRTVELSATAQVHKQGAAAAATTTEANPFAATPAWWPKGQSNPHPSEQYTSGDGVREGHLPTQWVVPAGDAGVHFRRIGTMVGSLDYGHIGFDINLKDIRDTYAEQCFNLLKAMRDPQHGYAAEEQANFTAAQNKTIENGMAFVQSSAFGLTEICKSSLARLDGAISMFTDVSILQDHAKGKRETRTDECPHCQDTILSRQPRQVFMAVGLAFLLGAAVTAIGTLLFSQTKLIDVSASFDAGSSDEEIEVLQEHEKQTTLNKKAINDLKYEVTKLTARLYQFMEFIERPIKAYWALLYLTRDLDRIIDGVEELSHYKMTQKLVAPSSLVRAIKSLQARLAARGITVLPKQLHEFYELDLSYLYFTNHTMRVILHVPAYTDDTMLDLFEYVPTPLPVNDKFLLPMPEDQILAVDPRSASLYKAMSKSDLTTCKHSGHKYFCPGQNYYRKLEKPSCVMNLYLNRLANIAEECSFQVMKEKSDYLVQLSPHEFVLYHATNSRVSMNCKYFGNLQPEEAKEFFQGVRKVIVPPGCTAQTNAFTFQGQIDIFAMESHLSPHLSTALNLTEFLPMDLVRSDVQEVMEELSQVGSSDGVKVRDLVTMLKKARSQRLWNLSLGIGGTILLVLVVLLILYCCCCTDRKWLRCPPWKKSTDQATESSSPSLRQRFSDLLAKDVVEAEPEVERFVSPLTRPIVVPTREPGSPATPHRSRRAITYEDDITVADKPFRQTVARRK